MKTKTNKIEWKEIPLGDENYFEVIGSGINEFTGNKDYLSTESVKGTNIEKIESSITYGDRPSRANMQPILNSVWFAKMQSTLKVYAFSQENKQEMDKYILSTGFAGIKLLNEKIYLDYVRLYLITNKFNLEKDRLCTGSTQRAINHTFIKKLTIPLPFRGGEIDLNEQIRISNALREIIRSKERADKAEKLLDEYLRSIYYNMFLDKKFEIKKIRDVLKSSQYGTSTKSNSEGEGYKILGMNSITYDGRIDLSKHSFVDISKDDFNKLKLEVGDIIFNRTNSKELVGKTAYWNKKSEAVLASYLVKLKVNQLINPVFFAYTLNTERYKKLFLVRSKKAVNQANISPTLLRDFEIMIPPLNLQQKFSKIVEHVEKLKENVNKTKQNSEELFDSLMGKAFKGEL